MSHEAFSDDPRHLEDLHAWHVLRPLLDAGGYLPWSTGSMRAAGLVVVCNAVVHGDRRTLVECGSGVSTVVLARLLRARGAGSLVALEHDGGWAALVADLLAREGLGDVARVVHAPLEGDPTWYAAAAVDALPEGIDLLVVDGPPADRPGMGQARQPALERLGPKLAPGATVVLDDVGRPGEQEVLARWAAESPLRFVVDPGAGIAVGS